MLPATSSACLFLPYGGSAPLRAKLDFAENVTILLWVYYSEDSWIATAELVW